MHGYSVVIHGHFTSKNHTQMTANGLPAPNLTSMKLTIRQHPKRARMSGLGEIISRRLLDPPLIVMASFPASTNLSKYQNRLVCSASLFGISACKNGRNQEDLDVSTVIVPSHSWQAAPARPTCLTVLMGSTKISPSILQDVDGSLQVFFVFNDLSVRIQGDFQIRCDLFDIMAGTSDSCISQIFTVYPPQSYPGVLRKLNRYF